MLTKAVEKYINSLRIKKFRDLNRAFVAEGEKIVPEILASGFTIQHVVATTGWLKNNTLPAAYSAMVAEASEAQMEKLSEFKTPQGVLVVAGIPETAVDEMVVAQGLSLVLEQIQDPGNLGTIIRIADWFGIPYIFTSAGTTDVFNPKAIQASMGSVVRVKVAETDLLKLLYQYPRLPSYACVLGGKDIFSQPLSDKGFILIGNESRGLSAALQQAATHNISIPSFGKAESLNAAVAAGIVCAQFRAGK